MRRSRELLAGLAALLVPIVAGAQAQPPAAGSVDTAIFYRALDLESNGKYREAAPLFRQALRSAAAVNALLGLERVYAELGWADSLLAPVDSLIARDPRETTFRTVQLRTLATLGRDREARQAFERWTRDMPSNPAPYREYARLLLQRNQAAAADSIVRRGSESLGSASEMHLEVAQARAAMGLWDESAREWRQALREQPYLVQAAAYALAPTPIEGRETVRQILRAPPAEAAARSALADLELSWGSTVGAWEALADLRPDSASAEAWTGFAARAEAEERWTLARAALSAALGWRPTPELAVRAAAAALNAGDPQGAITLAPMPAPVTDSAQVARVYVPLHARALARLGRPSMASRLVAQYDHFLSPGAKTQLTRTIALGWVRSGDMAKARETLTAAGAEGDSSDAAGWIALYEGNLRTARLLLRTGSETSPELALALAVVARVRADSAAALGAAFLSLARGDSAGAAQRFAGAAEQYGDAASILLLTAAQIHAARHEEPQAIVLWQRVVEQQAQSAEAPQAELEWARVLTRKGDASAAAARLEHLILNYPQSALVPEARRQLDIVRRSIPGTA